MTARAQVLGEDESKRAEREALGRSEVDWFRNTSVIPQFTLRSFVVGASSGRSWLEPLRRVEDGWGLGVAITSCILSYALGSALSRLRNAPIALFRFILYAVIVLAPTALVIFIVKSGDDRGHARDVRGCRVVHPGTASRRTSRCSRTTRCIDGILRRLLHGGTMVSAQAALLSSGKARALYLLMGWTFCLAVLGP
jgi:hypothetical protein